MRYSGQEQEFGGIVIDGRWIHFGDLSQPVGGVEASIDSGDALLHSSAFTRTAVERRLAGRAGPISSRMLTRAIDRAGTYVVIAGAQVWVTPATSGMDAEARRFVSWVSASSAHYRYG